jgi:uncharacterized membrane protein
MLFGIGIKKMTIQKSYPYILIVGSIIGLLASFFLMLNTIELIKNPAADLPCNLNPFISCGNAILSEAGEAFGFPNPLLGLISFSMLLATGILLFAGGRAHKIYYQLVNLGTLASTIFVVWFIYQSLFNLNSLCLYCMVVWAVTWPIFLYTTIWNFKEEHFILPPHRGHVSRQRIVDNIFGFVSKHHFQFLTSWYFLIIVAILLRFRDFFLY